MTFDPHETHEGTLKFVSETNPNDVIFFSSPGVCSPSGLLRRYAGKPHAIVLVAVTPSSQHAYQTAVHDEYEGVPKILTITSDLHKLTYGDAEYNRVSELEDSDDGQ